MMRKKKYLAVLALLLVAAMVSTATLAYAPNNGKSSVQGAQPGVKNSQKDKEKHDNKGGTQGHGNSNQDGQGKSNQGNQKKSDQNSNKQGKAENRKDSLDIEEIKASIAAVTDASTQSSLTALLKAYETALANEESGRAGGADKQTMKALEDAVAAAQGALVTALADAGIDAEESKPNGVGKGPQGPKHFDLATIEASIAKLNNPELQASLTALVKAYKTALANEQSGLANGADEATIAAYRKAAEDAKAAVLKALTGAGIRASETTATPSSLPKGQQKKLLNVDAIAASIATVTDTQTQASLTALTAAYKAAVANMENAWATGDEATKEASREAVKAAETALLEALNDAGISTAASPSSIQKPPQEQRVTGIWVAVVNWISNLFGKLTK